MIGRAAITQRDDGALVDPRSDADWLDWVPAGALRNWCANDLLVDWLVRRHDGAGSRRDLRRSGAGNGGRQRDDGYGAEK